MTDELPPFTADNKRALRELRFVTVNQARNRVIANDGDPNRLSAAGLSAHRYERATGVFDWEGTSGHPDAIAYVTKLLGLPDG